MNEPDDPFNTDLSDIEDVSEDSGEMFDESLFDYQEDADVEDDDVEDDGTKDAPQPLCPLRF
jgi:hypothetical protein